jgi:hypothetical protein
MSASNVDFTVVPTANGVIDASGKFTGQAPGTATIIGTLKTGLGAVRADTVTVKVKQGPFTGTVAQSAGRGGQILTFTAGAVKFDADTKLTITGAVDSVTFLEKDSTKIIVAVPFGKPAGSARRAPSRPREPARRGRRVHVRRQHNERGEIDDPTTAPAVPVAQIIGTPEPINVRVVITAGAIACGWINASGHRGIRDRRGPREPARPNSANPRSGRLR